MDKDQVIAAIKKNALSISLGVAALVALVATWFFVNPMIADLDQQVEERAAKAEAAQALLSAQRPAVQVDPTSAAGQERSLQTFPTSTVIAAGRETMEQVELQAGSVLNVAVEANRQVPLLQPDYETAAQAWPLERNTDDLARTEYQQAYRQYMNADGAAPDGRYPSASLPGRLNATRPPSQQEVANAVESLEARMASREERDETGKPVAADYEQRLTEARATLVTQLKFSRARNHMFYLDPSTEATGLDVHELATMEEPTAADIFNAQMELWVQENVLGNLLQANRAQVQSLAAEDRNLLNAPVKHIVGIQVHALLDGAMIDQTPAQPNTGVQRGGSGFIPGEGMEGMGMDPGLMGLGEPGYAPPGQMPGQAPQTGQRSGATGGAGGAGAGTSEPGGLAGPARSGGLAAQEDQNLPEVELPSEPSATVERQFAYSMTGRLPHTPVYDLMRFNLTLRCDASAVPYVLKQLQAGSLVTVLNVDVRAVDAAVAASQGYVYGNAPVVELDVQGEMVFLREWTADLMPTSIKQTLVEWSGGEVGGEDDGGMFAF